MFPRKINNNLWILGNNYFHIYLIVGEKACILVETGISATSDIICKQINSLKLKPDYLVVTHPHSDHITGLEYLRQSFPNSIVLAGEGVDSFINHPKAEQTMIIEDRHMTESLHTRQFINRNQVIKSVPSLSGYKLIKEGEELNLGGLTIDFLEAKGHSPGNIIVHIPDLTTLLVSDSLGNNYPGRGFFPTFFTGFADYMKTIDRLEKIDPIVLGLAHNGFFSRRNEIKDIFQKARKSANDVYEYIVDDKRSHDDIANDLFGFYYTDELSIYSPQNIMNCCRLLVRRVRESKSGQNDLSGK